ncbi:tetratricopeptide repeat protein [Pseudomonas japonica]|uniref:Tetratricopeptide repeat-containing protein n=1 Tax=Pseudomonas japonica TaxID=256466 RepID=A0A239EMZ4_9PSED|nr:tetratricopeptide repeat protein [Pseudomonas japonica]SNS46025.1 Tetratricopeptide repeat-containing protein [Pseudomonas japonica]
MLSTAFDNARVMALNDQAVQYRNQGCLDEAEQCFHEALHLAENVEGFDPASLATLRDGLAGLRWAQQRHAEAEALYLDVLSTRESLFSPSHQVVGQSLQTLGNCYLKQGRIGEAASMLERAVQVYREDTPDDLEPVSACLASLGLAHLQQDNLRAAHEAFSESLVIYQVQTPRNEQVIAVLGEQLKMIEHLGKGAWWKFW